MAQDLQSSNWMQFELWLKAVRMRRVSPFLLFRMLSPTFIFLCIDFFSSPSFSFLYCIRYGHWQSGQMYTQAFKRRRSFPQRIRNHQSGQMFGCLKQQDIHISSWRHIEVILLPRSSFSYPACKFYCFRDHNQERNDSNGKIVTILPTLIQLGFCGHGNPFLLCFLGLPRWWPSLFSFYLKLHFALGHDVSLQAGVLGLSWSGTLLGNTCCWID